MAKTRARSERETYFLSNRPLASFGNTLTSTHSSLQELPVSPSQTD